jgi:hypothetical protein
MDFLLFGFPQLHGINPPSVIRYHLGIRDLLDYQTIRTHEPQYGFEKADTADQDRLGSAWSIFLESTIEHLAQEWGV